MQPTFNRRQLLAASSAALALPALAQNGTDWSAVAAKAKGQTVYFNAWGGADTINAYIQWAATEVQKRFGVTVVHVKVTDTADVVKRVRNEKAAGKSNGTVDMVWINGENFLTMKREGLLFGPFSERLPAYSKVDTQGKPTTRVDFSEPVEGMEAPWGMAQLTFMVDSQRTPKPPQNMAELLAYAKANPGRITYPRPPNFHGVTFLKQVLLDSTSDRNAFYKPASPDTFAKATAPLWATLDQLHPHLWRAGKQFPQNAEAIRQMLADGELHWALTFNPNDAANEIVAKRS
jgi:putative thiamine transport system substrate-binding protein